MSLIYFEIEFHVVGSPYSHVIQYVLFRRIVYDISLDQSMNQCQEFIILTQDVVFEHE